MRMTRSRFFFALSSLLLMWCLPSFAQVTTGTPPFGSFGGGPDILNLANLNAHISVPILNKSGRGAAFTYDLSYDGAVWYPVGVSGSQVWTPAYNWGWRGQTEANTGYISFTATSTVCSYEREGTLEIPNGWRFIQENFAYHDPWGVPHPFSGLASYESATCGGATTHINAVATDGSGYLISGGWGATYITTKSGATFNVPYGTGSGAATSTETNGNEITINSSGQFFDTLSSTTPVLTVAGTAPSPTTFTYTAPTGSNVSYTMKYTGYTVQTSFGCSGISEYSASGLYLVSEIDLPNGTKYTFTYEPTPGHAGDVTGRLASVTLPTGGTISYVYSGGSNGITCADGSTATLTRTTPDGTWTYAHTESGSTWTTTETAPQMPYDSAANQTVYTFNSSAQITSKKIYQGSSTGGSLLRTINTTWASNNTPATQITILEDNSTQSEIETTYDNYGNLLTLREHDYGTGAPGPVLRTTNYTYLSTSAYTNLNIMDRVTEKTIADASGTIQYREDHSYDGTTISPCPTGVPQHNDTNYGCSFTTRGNHTSVTTYTNASTPSGGVTKNSYYDVFGNLVQQDVDCCESTAFTLSSATQYSAPDSKTCGASGGPQLTTTYTYNAYSDQLASETDANNQTTSYTYDAMFRPLSITRPDHSQISYSYNDTIHSVTLTTPIDSSHAKSQTTYQDGLGRTNQETINDASQNLYSAVQIQYDPVGRNYKRSNPYTSSPQYWVTTQYDTLRRITKRILEDNSQSTFSYSTKTLTVTDPAGHQRKSQFDGLHRTVTIYEPDPTNNNSLTLQTTFAYMVLGRVATITQGSQARTFSYDGMGRLASETQPESGTTSYQYNSFDKITQRTDNRGVITSYSYDTVDRLAQVSYNVGSTGVPATPSVTYSYGTNASQYNNGRMITMTDGSGSTAYSYDLIGRITQEIQTVNTVPYTLDYQYNENSDVTLLTYSSGRVVQQTYDAIGRAASITSGSSTYLSGLTYNPNFNRMAFTLGNGVSGSMTYAADRKQLQSIAYAFSGSTLFGQTYTYGSSGSNDDMLTQISDAVDPGRNMTYVYDALNRITSAASQGSANYPQWGLSWTYDRYGNRLSQNVTAGTAPASSVAVSSTTNRITTSGYSYDANGNMTNDAVNTIVYDAENRVVSDTDGSGTATYSYNGRGLRVQKSFGGTNTAYVFAQGNVTAEYANGTLTEEYIYDGNNLLADYASGVLTYHGFDRLSDRINMNVSGAKIGEQGHYPFGESWYATNSTTKWRFTNYEHDAESNNDYAKARFYVNRLGRFLTNDPDRPRAGNPQRLNAYAYVASEPIDRNDPTGRYACVCPLRGWGASHCGCFCSDPMGGFGGCTPGEEGCDEWGDCDDEPTEPPASPPAATGCTPTVDIPSYQEVPCNGTTQNLATASAGGRAVEEGKAYDITASATTDNDLVINLLGKAQKSYWSTPTDIIWQQGFIAYKVPEYPKAHVKWSVSYKCNGEGAEPIIGSTEIRCK